MNKLNFRYIRTCESCVYYNLNHRCVIDAANGGRVSGKTICDRHAVCDDMQEYHYSLTYIYRKLNIACIKSRFPEWQDEEVRE